MDHVLTTAAPALLTTSSGESVPPETPIAPTIAPLFNQRDPATGRNNSVECEEVVEMHEIDAVLEDFGWATEPVTDEEYNAVK